MSSYNTAPCMTETQARKMVNSIKKRIQDNESELAIAVNSFELLRFEVGELQLRVSSYHYSHVSTAYEIGHTERAEQDGRNLEYATMLMQLADAHQRLVNQHRRVRELLLRGENLWKLREQRERNYMMVTNPEDYPDGVKLLDGESG